MNRREVVSGTGDVHGSFEVDDWQSRSLKDEEQHHVACTLKRKGPFWLCQISVRHVDIYETQQVNHCCCIYRGEQNTAQATTKFWMHMQIQWSSTRTRERTRGTKKKLLGNGKCRERQTTKV